MNIKQGESWEETRKRNGMNEPEFVKKEKELIESLLYDGTHVMDNDGNIITKSYPTREFRYIIKRLNNSRSMKEIIIIKKGEIVKVGGIPVELLEDTKVYSETFLSPSSEDKEL